MAPRKTSFNIKWKNIYPWIDSVSDDNFKAFCKLCKKTFSISSKGEGCIKEHSEGAKHKDAAKSTTSSQSLHRFFSRAYEFNNEK